MSRRRRIAALVASAAALALLVAAPVSMGASAKTDKGTGSSFGSKPYMRG